jgi:hypothetical protein
MFRTQPKGFRWLVGGVALLGAIAFAYQFFVEADRPSLVFGVVCLVFAGYWLIIDREPDEPPEV